VLVDADRSLDELSDLPHGWEAERLNITEMWIRKKTP
jgi:hypothetical protein